MLRTNTKKNVKRNEIKLSQYQQDNMQFDQDYYFRSGKFYYTIGLIPEPRLRKLVGRKDTYVIVRYNDKDVKFVKKTHDLTEAEFGLSSALNADFYNHVFFEMRKVLKQDHNKNVQDRRVGTEETQAIERKITELGILSDIFNNRIDVDGLEKGDIDSFVKLQVNRSMKRSKKQKSQVVILPENLPEM